MEPSNEKELFRLPKNVRQIGQADTQLKLYVEDYVMTLFRQLARRSSMEYQMAVLLGNVKTSSNCSYIFINGAVEVHELMLTEDSEFTEETWSGIYSQIKEYFKEEELLGWYLTRPGLIDIPDEKMTRIHEKNFPGEEKLMILFDSLGERENLYLTQKEDFKRLKGYFIYYEKNPHMQEYMIAQSENRSIENGYDDELMRKLRSCANRQEPEKNPQKEKPPVLPKIPVRKWGYAVGALVLLLMVGAGMYARSRVGEKTEPKEVPASATSKEDTTKWEEPFLLTDEDAQDGETEKTQEDLGNWERYEPTADELLLPEVTLPAQTEEPSKETGKHEKADRDEAAETDNTGVEADGEKNTETENTGAEADGEKNTEIENTGAEADGEKNTEAENTDQKKHPEKAEPAEETYIVKKGDTLASISMQMYQTAEKADLIRQANDIEDIDLILIGQRLRIPR